MSVTRILCPKCGAPLCYCKCEPNPDWIEAKRECLVADLKGSRVERGTEGHPPGVARWRNPAINVVDYRWTKWALFRMALARPFQRLRYWCCRPFERERPPAPPCYYDPVMYGFAVAESKTGFGGPPRLDGVRTRKVSVCTGYCPPMEIEVEEFLGDQETGKKETK